MSYDNTNKAAAWVKKTKEGETYLSCFTTLVGGVKVGWGLFHNKEKTEGDELPDWIGRIFGGGSEKYVGEVEANYQSNDEGGKYLQGVATNNETGVVFDFTLKRNEGKKADNQPDYVGKITIKSETVQKTTNGEPAANSDLPF